MKLRKTHFSCLLILFIIALAIVPSALAVDQKMRVAVFEFDVKGDLGIKDAGSIIAESLITSLTQSNAFALKERVLLKKILEEQSLSGTGIISKETAAEIGKIYGVEGIITGSITKWNRLIQVNARLIGTKDGSVLRGAKIETTDINEIPLLINALAADIAKSPETRERALAESTPASPPPQRSVEKKEKKETISAANSATQLPPPKSAAVDTKKPDPAPALKALPIIEPEPEPLITNKQGMTFALIPAGTFLMGSSGGDKYVNKDETPPHRVTISRPFYMQTTEVTQGQWREIMGANPSHFRSCGDDCPVEQVSWQEVQTFIRKLNQKEKTDTYRLPTEAEWEYAARGGAKQESWSGTSAEDQLTEYIHYDIYRSSGQSSAQRQPLPVKSKKPNSFGLYDMNGNVAEWVDDWYGEYSADQITNPRGPASGVYRVYRGGSFADKAEKCRTASRSGLAPANGDSTIGFRLVKTR
jgi:formylglycine-generating enzyme required for sulfatase activity/TolB-like protein